MIQLLLITIFFLVIAIINVVIIFTFANTLRVAIVNKLLNKQLLIKRAELSLLSNFIKTFFISIYCIPFVSLIILNLSSLKSRYSTNIHYLSCDSLTNFFDPMYSWVLIVVTFISLAGYLISKDFIIKSVKVTKVIASCIALGIITGLVLFIHLLYGGSYINYKYTFKPYGVGHAIFLIPTIIAYSIQFKVVIKEYIKNTETGEESPTVTLLIIETLINIPLIYAFIGILFKRRPDAFFLGLQNSFGYTFSTIPNCITPSSCYLCTVATYGHPSLIKPVTYGYRNNQKIAVSKQLLIAGVFEEWLSKKYPMLHIMLRYPYNLISKNFLSIVEINHDKRWIKVLADITYLIFKPIELVILLILKIAKPSLIVALRKQLKRYR
jgi:hypothetical protein